MPQWASKTGSELFIVDTSDEAWKALRYHHDWCQLSKAIDIATGYFEIGALLGLKDEWQKVDRIRVLMGDEVTRRTKAALTEGIRARLDASLEAEKEKDDLLSGVPAVVEPLRAGKIECRVYRKKKFHAKAYITHARLEVVGSFGLVGSSNFTYPGMTENIELNAQIESSAYAFACSCDRLLVKLLAFAPAAPPVQQGLLSWTDAAGRAAWYLYDMATDKILEEATAMLALIRFRPETPRQCVLEDKTLAEIRPKVEKHSDRSYLRSLQAPQGVKPVLRAWMELS